MNVILDAHGIMPTRSHEHDAGLDMYTPERIKIGPHDTWIVDTGVHVAIPTGCYGRLTSRSSVFKQGITIEGTIDSGYTGSVKIVLWNISDNIVEFQAGDRIAQLIVEPCILCPLTMVESMQDTERGSGGFGSTGK